MGGVGKGREERKVEMVGRRERHGGDLGMVIQNAESKAQPPQNETKQNANKVRDEQSRRKKPGGYQGNKAPAPEQPEQASQPTTLPKTASR